MKLVTSGSQMDCTKSTKRKRQRQTLITTNNDEDDEPSTQVYELTSDDEKSQSTNKLINLLHDDDIIDSESDNCLPLINPSFKPLSTKSVEEISDDSNDELCYKPSHDDDLIDSESDEKDFKIIKNQKTRLEPIIPIVSVPPTECQRTDRIRPCFNTNIQVANDSHPLKKICTERNSKTKKIIDLT